MYLYKVCRMLMDSEDKPRFVSTYMAGTKYSQEYKLGEQIVNTQRPFFLYRNRDAAKRGAANLNLGTGYKPYVILKCLCTGVIETPPEWVLSWNTGSEMMELYWSNFLAAYQKEGKAYLSCDETMDAIKPAMKDEFDAYQLQPIVEGTFLATHVTPLKIV